ncbi:glutamyl-tRNA(Gln) amidotransferase subunit B, putative [Plasmodium malariae]|uniref:Glutamyl-tRNA(Gln) amidotransferase subunit B, putative n=1 Tax=Plasmodium malariae TaxID=5858 RepID=A0A1A8W5Q4_PLAMA|nr:glutamyl-tRNA(Gln) amidotransferase subunit B, putative [Plasmodium malariae]SBS87012.1 glutamyl-tRNA(Gln) amidotransferase subunit B, putative [Plasmodium malariae]SCO93097.1 glutamyl-tRNA(Gln) amidotransferase subunit B, putative [Plasmodium malariae]
MIICAFFLYVILTYSEIILCFKINNIYNQSSWLLHNKYVKKYSRIKNNLDNNVINHNVNIKESVERNIKCKIGVEVHVQLSTKYKAFCNCFNISSLYREKTYGKNNIDLINFLNENIFKKIQKGNEKRHTSNGELKRIMQEQNINVDEPHKNVKNHVNNNASNEVSSAVSNDFGNDVSNNSSITKPNKHICNICIGEVGSLCILNTFALLFTYLICIILNCNLATYITFDRKIYNYYDLPKGYQITQKEKPLGTEGYIYVNEKKFLVKSVHLEEDTSKCLLYTSGTNTSNKEYDNEITGKESILQTPGNTNQSVYNNNVNLNDKDLAGNSSDKGDPDLSNNYNEINNRNKKVLLDYNRCGIPLAEIVIEKDYMSADDCINLLKEIKKKVCLLGVCVGNKENIRSDINISFEYNNVNYNRVEIKNINSFRKIRNCIQHEKENFLRSITANNTSSRCQNGVNNIYTKSYLDNTQYILRKKEEYNYVHEMNIPEYVLGKNILKLLKFYVNYKIKIYEDEIKYKWSKQYFHVFFNDPFLYNYFNECLKFEDEKNVSNFIVNTLLDVVKKKNILSKNIQIKPKHICYLINYATKNNLDNTFLKNVLFKYIDVGFEKDNLLENLKNVSFQEMQDTLKKLIDENMKYLKIDGNKNVLNEQNFKNRIIGLLKNKINQENSLLSVNYKFVSTFIFDYIKKSV